ncbi:MAG TPA: isocitrate lyase/PEP mutase family protein [Rhizomicrobium sp.]|jgi:2-methylisocitrate lyase-like PEP mutase family enzyme
MTTLDALLASGQPFVLPGAYDALSARIAAHSGAPAVYMTGFGVVGASFGVPDIGSIGPEAMTERVRALAKAIAPMPLVADGDNGHGDVAGLVRAYEAAGAAAIQIEDQVIPKRCGHMDGKEVVAFDEAVRQIKDAAASRGAIKIVARTDAGAVHGLDEALRRADAFAKAGADVLFIEAARNEEELVRIAREFAGFPTLANMVEDGKTPWRTPDALFAMGYRIVLKPISALLAVTRTLEKIYAGETAERVTFQHYNEVVGLS